MIKKSDGMTDTDIELYEHMCKAAIDNLRDHGNLLPITIFVDPNGKWHLVPHKYDSPALKDAVAMALRAIANATRAVTAVSVREAWVVTTTPDKNGKVPHITPSEHPDRQEMIMISVEKRGWTWMASIPITRINGVPDVSSDVPELVEWPEVKGRFTHLLDGVMAGSQGASLN